MPQTVAGLPVPCTRLLAADIYALQDIRQRQRDYLQAVEPIARERAKLAMMFTRLTFFPETGEVRRDYPPEIQAIDDKYVELTKVLQLRFIGTANTTAHPRAAQGDAKHD
jgi:hypothetical protein